MYFLSSHKPTVTEGNQASLKPVIHKISLLILPSSCCRFPSKLVAKLWCQVEITTLFDKFGYSHYLFVGGCIGVIGRIYKLIASGSQRVKEELI